MAPKALGNVGGGKEGVSPNLLDELFVEVGEASYGLEVEDDAEVLLLLVDESVF